MEYTLITSREKLGRAADYVDSMADKYGIGENAIFYADRDGNPVPWIDTGYLSEKALEAIRHRYTVKEGYPFL